MRREERGEARRREERGEARRGEEKRGDNSSIII